MNKTQKILIIGLLFLAFVFIFAGYYIQKKILAPPNVVFILIDTVRADCINPELNPNPITPFLSNLTKKSIYIPNAITPCSWTKPTLATFLTGLPPEKHGVRYSVMKEDPNAPTSDILSDAILTLPEYLAQHGYETYAVQTNANLAPLLGFAQGFKKSHFYFDNGGIASTVTTKSLEFMRNPRQPFFLYAHYMDPHMPYTPPDSFLQYFKTTANITDEEKSRLEPDPFFEYATNLIYYLIGKREEPPPFELSTSAQNEIKRRYHAEIRFTDAEIEKLVQFISHKFPNTIFFIISDHGEEFWEHKGVGHGTTVYEEQIRVPVIIYGKGILPKRVDKNISTAGLAKTIVSLIGLPIPPQFEGYDLIKQNDDVISKIVTWGPWSDMDLNLEAVVDYPWKLILDKNKNTVKLFNISNDPNENLDISADYPNTVQKLMSYISNEEQEKYYNTGNTTSLPPDMIQKLKALGYLD
ncbi:MAG TPA: sulfatase [Candidatus Hydrogenedens sp.]|nr:sulfatase [Candidatus Hydrogenedens sp.]HOL20306.1 sulfatase [Candidatus Hydrogenedens sp.]HPP59853.1 sulfatase [Candidatus Hydrogenedens sp.]